MMKTAISADNHKMTVEEFKKFTQMHQRRVHNLGQYLFHEFKSQFNHVNFDLVSEFLALHDQAKTSTNTDGIQQIELLYQFFGVNKSELPENEKFQILSTINHINYLDAQKALQFFNEKNLIKSNGELSASAESLLLIEKISDMVDRGLCKTAATEFNRKLTPASQILTDAPSLYAKFLEDHYQQIIVDTKQPLKKID